MIGYIAAFPVKCGYLIFEMFVRVRGNFYLCAQIASYMHKGIISLTRDTGTFQAGFCILQLPFSALKLQLSLLHPDESRYYHSLQFDKRRASYLLGRLCAKTAVAQLLPEASLASIAIMSGVFQFPVVKHFIARNIQVSITHCNELGLALAYPEEHPLGIDIEEIDEGHLEALVTQIADAEMTLVKKAGLSSVVGCTMVWTIKEALSKIFRTGLTMDFKLLEIGSLVPGGNLFVSDFKHLIQYKAISCIAGKYVCTVVLPKNTTAALDEFWIKFRQAALQQ